MRNSISVIVTNWNGQKLLQKYFESVVKNTPEAKEIIFADDASTDDSLNFIAQLQKKYPKIIIAHRNKNLGFAKNSNLAVKQASGDLVVLLNNDIYTPPGYLQNTLQHFSDDQVFGVGLAEKGNLNWPKLFWKNGYIQYEPVVNYPKSHSAGWLSGGSSIVRKSIFTRLGGFDPVYAPFYSEDLDLGFRAWKSGYTLIWEPKSVVEHHHESTISKFPRHFLNYVKERNRLLTVWRNVSDPTLLWQNRLALVGRCLSGPNYLKIILAAKKQIKKFPPPIFIPKLTEKEVFSLFTK